MTQPGGTERAAEAGSGQPQPLSVPGLEGIEAAFTDLNTLTAVNCDTRTFAGEAEKRAAFLLSVSVDENGIAHCLDKQSGVETLLAAIAVDAQKTATLVPLELGPNQTLQLPVSADVPTRFGFLAGHLASRDVSLAFRMGLYPGLPLVTETRTDTQNREIYVGLRGIKPDEIDEQSWAEQVEAFTRLGFNPQKSRGVFDRFHRPNQDTDAWKAYPLVALPNQILDLLSHYDATQVKIDTFQMLFYGTRNSLVHPGRRPISDFYDQLYGNSGGSYMGATRGGGEQLTLGTKGLGIGFGEAVPTRAQVSGVDVESVVGAFEVIVVPK